MGTFHKVTTYRQKTWKTNPFAPNTPLELSCTTSCTDLISSENWIPKSRSHIIHLNPSRMATSHYAYRFTLGCSQKSPLRVECATQVKQYHMPKPWGCGALPEVAFRMVLEPISQVWRFVGDLRALSPRKLAKFAWWISIASAWALGEVKNTATIMMQFPLLENFNWISTGSKFIRTYCLVCRDS